MRILRPCEQISTFFFFGLIEMFQKDLKSFLNFKRTLPSADPVADLPLFPGLDQIVKLTVKFPLTCPS